MKLFFLSKFTNNMCVELENDKKGQENAQLATMY